MILYSGKLLLFFFSFLTRIQKISTHKRHQKSLRDLLVTSLSLLDVTLKIYFSEFQGLFVEHNDID